MKPALRNQLRHLDQTLVQILDERARLLAETEPGDPGRAPSVEDLLRRHDGPCPPEVIREIFAVVERASRLGDRS
jgi:hypothetical protein